MVILDTYKDFFFNNLDKIIYFFLISFYLFIIFQFFSFDYYFKQVSSNCVGCFSILNIFFKENSHLALIAPPVIFYLLFISNYNKFINYFSVIIFLLICFVNPSLTLYIGLIILFFFTLFIKLKLFKFKKIFLILMICFALFKLYTDNVAKIKVTDFFNENNNINLSTEVYKTSYLVAKNTIFYKPLGYGFNNYSEAFDKFVSDMSIYNKEVLLLNRKDASNNFSKIVTEFGIFSIFFFYFLISFLFNKKIDNKIRIFLALPIIIQTFVRGAGYFNGGFVLFVFFAFVLWIKAYLKNHSFK
jgi:O-antigen ligase